MVHDIIRLGCHVSISGSIELAFTRAEQLGCNTFQVFTKNPRGWAARELKEKEIDSFREKLNKKNFFPVVSHISYLPNLASQNPETYKKSIDSFKLEVERCLNLKMPYFVIHGGSYKGGTFKQGLEVYINSILKGIEYGQGKVAILIENSSGGKNSLTGTFFNIEKIMTEINDETAIKVCFDTCHAFGSGYDLRNEQAVNDTLQEIEATIGCNSIALVHANDSLGELGSHRDRHQHLGLGHIGEEGFRAMLNNNFLNNKPWILETPIDEIRDDVGNLQYLRLLQNK